MRFSSDRTLSWLRRLSLLDSERAGPGPSGMLIRSVVCSAADSAAASMGLAGGAAAC